MPPIFRIGAYWVYFWTNESMPLEPVHVHVAQGSPTENATKIWIIQISYPPGVQNAPGGCCVGFCVVRNGSDA